MTIHRGILDVDVGAARSFDPADKDRILDMVNRELVGGVPEMEQEIRDRLLGSFAEAEAVAEALVVANQKGLDSFKNLVTRWPRVMHLGLEHADEDIRCSALEALSKKSDRIDDHAVGLTAARLEDVSSRVRALAVEALCGLAGCAAAKECAIRAVSARLGHSAVEVRLSAISPLSRLVKNGSDHAINEVASYREHRDEGVRKTTVEAIVQVAEKGDKRAIDAVAARLEHSDRNVRQAAMQTLAQMAGISPRAVLALQYASEEMKKNETIVMAAVQHNGLALEWASEEQKRNTKVVQAAVRQNPAALQHVLDEAIVMAAMQQNSSVLEYVSENEKERENCHVGKGAAGWKCAPARLRRDEKQ